MKSTMKLLLTLLLFIVSTQVGMGNTESNSFLILKDNKRNKKHYFSENQKIKVWTSDEQKYAGRLTILNDSTISVGDDEIEISEITLFKATTRNRRIIGGVVALAPVVATGVTVGVIMGIEGGFELGSVIYGAAGTAVCAVLGPIGAIIGISKKKNIDEERYSLSVASH
ncbi:MAG: hypothetical protein ACI8ZM_001054 [Crocinitomix sp.]|jgi:hypothetical protein